MSCENWIPSAMELPPSDGFYEITNHLSQCENDFGYLHYDGYGFTKNGIYYNPKFWRNCGKKEKKYGKVQK